MPKLTEKERESFEGIMKADMNAINSKLMQQIKEFWGIARKHVEHELGHDRLMQEKHELLKQQEEIRNKIHMIETKLRSEPLRAEQIAELGGSKDNYGRFQGANFYGIPVEGQFDYKIVDYIRNNINLEIPTKFLHDLGRSCMRELTMSGTFEEARASYEKFYSLDFRKYGVDIPPRLSEVKDEVLQLQQTQQTLSLEAQKHKEQLENQKQNQEDNQYIG